MYVNEKLQVIFVFLVGTGEKDPWWAFFNLQKLQLSSKIKVQSLLGMLLTL